MGVIYSVFAFDSEFLQHAREWLDEIGVILPALSATVRNPTPREVAQVLRELHNCSANISADLSKGEWSAEIVSTDSQKPAWTELRIENYSSEDKAHHFYFCKGWLELIFLIVERMAHICGPLLVYADSGNLAIVRPGDAFEGFRLRF